MARGNPREFGRVYATRDVEIQPFSPGDVPLKFFGNTMPAWHVSWTMEPDHLQSGVALARTMLASLVQTVCTESTPGVPLTERYPSAENVAELQAVAAAHCPTHQTGPNRSSGPIFNWHPVAPGTTYSASRLADAAFIRSWRDARTARTSHHGSAVAACHMPDHRNSRCPTQWTAWRRAVREKDPGQMN